MHPKNHSQLFLYALDNVFFHPFSPSVAKAVQQQSMQLTLAIGTLTRHACMKMNWKSDMQWRKKSPKVLSSVRIFLWWPNCGTLTMIWKMLNKLAVSAATNLVWTISICIWCIIHWPSNDALHLNRGPKMQTDNQIWRKYWLQKEGQPFFLLFRKLQKQNLNVVHYRDVDYIDTWKAMEKLVESGLVKSIGISNFSIEQIERLLANCRIKPVTNQVRTNTQMSRKMDFHRNLQKFHQRVTSFLIFSLSIFSVDSSISSNQSKEIDWILSKP